MTHVINKDELPHSGSAHRFEGYLHGDANVSFFLSDTPLGKGPGLHIHPYAEVFVVQDGTATFTVAGEELTVEEGHVVVVPAETPHGFKNRADATLRVVSVHPNGAVLQTDL